MVWVFVPPPRLFLDVNGRTYAAAWATDSSVESPIETFFLAAEPSPAPRRGIGYPAAEEHVETV